MTWKRSHSSAEGNLRRDFNGKLSVAVMVELCPSRSCWHLYPLFENKSVFGEDQTDQVKMRWLRWVLIQYDCVPIKRGDLVTETCTQGECHVKIGIMLPQAKEQQRFLAKHPKPTEMHGTEEIWERAHSLQEETTLQTLRFCASSLQSCGTIHFCCLSHLVCSICHGSPGNQYVCINESISTFFGKYNSGHGSKH